MAILDELHKNRERFLAFNSAKYRIMEQTINSATVRRVLHFIPLLLSLNHKRLPGYIEGDTPFSIASYVPNPEDVRQFQARFHLKELSLHNDPPFIETIAVMGSVGTIAYTSDSDFDIWICIDKQTIPRARLENFKKKVEAIRRWAQDETGVEFHLFINDINAIKANLFSESKEEAFGSIIGAVLKDEFFRSSIILAGKIPFWWVLPRFVRDLEYNRLFASVSDEEREKYYVDFGNLYEIDKEDFIGAALFLIIKSLGNPFKAILKLGLLEKYLFGPEYSPLLSQKIRSNILRGEIEGIILDSYQLMFEEVYRYYESCVDDPSRINILRECMYLKVAPQISRYLGVKDRRNLPSRVLTMFRYVNEWGWNIDTVRDLDSFASWDYRRTVEFWNAVKRFMLTSYQKILTQIPGMKFRERISENDFKLLSRKIQSHFSVQPNKIDHYITFKDTPSETWLIIEPTGEEGRDATQWRMSKKDRESETNETVTIRSEKSLVRLLAWGAINGIYNPDFTRLKYESGMTKIAQSTVIDLLTAISRQVTGALSCVKNEYFLRPSFRLVHMIILNFGVEQADHIRSIHHLTLTSWGESYLDEYREERDLLKILECVLREGMIAGSSFAEYCVFFAPESSRKLCRAIEHIFHRAYDYLAAASDKASRRFITKIAGCYLTITRGHGSLSLSADADIVRAFTRLSLRPQARISYEIEGDDKRLVILNEVFKARKQNALTAAYEESGDHLILYLINERDNCFVFFHKKKFKDEVLTVLYGFCKKIVDRVMAEQPIHAINAGFTLYAITADRFGTIALQNRTNWLEETYLVRYRRTTWLSVQVSMQQSGESLYSISRQGETPRESVPLKKFSELVKTSGMPLPPLIGDISFKDMNEEERSRGTTPYIFEKYRLEMSLTLGGTVSSQENYPGKT